MEQYFQEQQPAILLPPPPALPTQPTCSSDISNKDLLLSMNQRFDKMTDAINELHFEMEDMKKDYEFIIKTTKEENEKMKNHVKRLELKIDDLENRQRRDNLVFYGVDENEEGETWAESEVKLKEIISVDLELEDDIQFDRAHRIGKKIRGKKRPIICKLTRYKDKELILKNSFKLKNQDPDAGGNFVAISQDYSEPVRKARKKLNAYRREHEIENAKLKMDKLYCGNKVYWYNDETDTVQELRRK